jgi:hypothetical protein
MHPPPLLVATVFAGSLLHAASTKLPPDSVALSPEGRQMPTKEAAEGRVESGESAGRSGRGMILNPP